MLAPALNRRFGIHCPLDHGILDITNGFLPLDLVHRVISEVARSLAGISYLDYT